MTFPGTINAVDVIEILPGELAARLEADEYFCDIPVVVADEGNIKLTLDKKTAAITAKTGKRGVAVIVLQIVADDDFPNLAFGPLTLRPSFQVIELREINRGVGGTKKPWRKVARRVRDVIKCFGAPGLIASIKAANPCIEPVPFEKLDGQNLIGGLVNFECLEADPEQLTQAQMPRPAQADNLLTLTTPTVGGVIYYSTDGSYPAPAKDNSFPYVDPIPVPETGVIVRCCTYAPGKIASWVNTVTAVPN